MEKGIKMTFKKWYAINHDKLQEDYEEYVESLDKRFYMPIDFDEFVQDKWDSFDEYVEKEERE